MQLYLVQHAQAKSEAEDPQRPLTDEGRKVALRMADFIARRNIRVHQIWHSGKLRARQTAEIFAQALYPPGGVHEKPGLGPLDDVAPLVAALNQVQDGLMIVGHLPHLSRLVSRLLGREETKTIVNFQMVGIVCLERVAMGDWFLGWIVTSQLLPKQAE
jgi:phosphohistidine phosphatase